MPWASIVDAPFLSVMMPTNCFSFGFHTGAGVDAVGVCMCVSVCCCHHHWLAILLIFWVLHRHRRRLRRRHYCNWPSLSASFQMLSAASAGRPGEKTLKCETYFKHEYEKNVPMFQRNRVMSCLAFFLSMSFRNIIYAACLFTLKLLLFKVNWLALCGDGGLF